MTRFIIILVVGLNIFCYYSYAQDVTVAVSADTTEIKTGEPVKLLLTLSYQANSGKHVSIDWPLINDTITKKIEVISQSKIDTIVSDSLGVFQFKQQKTIVITSFDPGTITIPPLRFVIKNDSDTVASLPILLTVEGVDVSTDQDIKDISPLMQVDYTIWDWLREYRYAIIGSVVVFVLLALLIYFVRKNRREKPTEIIEETPPLPAHIIALEKLNQLKDDKLWQQGKVKEYYVSIAEILREYIENRFQLPALEQTTEEILVGFRNVDVIDENRNKLKQVLVLSDLVKFAKEQPLATENDLSLSNAFDFINATKKEE